MIVNFADKITEQIFSGLVVAKIDLGLQKLALRRLRYIHAASRIEDLMVPPSNRLEKLKGDLKDFYSVRVNNQWRIVFRWQDGKATDVQFIDYHWEDVIMTHIDIDHPGTLLREDFLNDLAIKPATLARTIGVDRAAIKAILDGKRSITAEMSIKLGLALGLSPAFWLNLQSDYDLRKAEQDNGEYLRQSIKPLRAA